VTRVDEEVAHATVQARTPVTRLSARNL